MGLASSRTGVCFVVLSWVLASACASLEVPWRYHYDPRHREHRMIYEMCVESPAFERCMQENLISLPDFGETLTR